MKYIAILLLTMSVAHAGKPMPMKQAPINQRQAQEQAQETNVNTEVNTTVSTVVDTAVNTVVTSDQSQNMGDMIGGTQSMEFNQVRQAHSANAPSVYATGPCFGGVSGAIGLPKVNFGGGKATRDEQCDMRETARMLIGAGEVELGVALLCMTESGSLLGDSCAYTGHIRADLAAARDRIAFLLNEREIDRKNCEDSKDRIFKACQQK